MRRHVAKPTHPSRRCGPAGVAPARQPGRAVPPVANSPRPDRGPLRPDGQPYPWRTDHGRPARTPAGLIRSVSNGGQRARYLTRRRATARGPAVLTRQQRLSHGRRMAYRKRRSLPLTTDSVIKAISYLLPAGRRHRKTSSSPPPRSLAHPGPVPRQPRGNGRQRCASFQSDTQRAAAQPGGCAGCCAPVLADAPGHAAPH